MWRTVQFSEAYAAGLVATNAVPNCPVFNRGYAPMFDRGASQDEVFMALAKYVPAISSAVGHVAVDDTVVTENHDLAILDGAGALHSGWGRPVSGSSLVWKHSDMKDMAYFYVWTLYRELVEEKGSLR